MHDLRPDGKLRKITGGTVVETVAERDDQVGVVHGDGTRVMSVHALHAEEPRMRGGDGGQAHHAAADDAVHLIGKFQHLFFRFAGDHAAADVDKGLFRLVDGFGRLLDADILGGILRVFLEGLFGLVFVHRRLDVLRNVHEHGAGPVGSSQDKGLSDRLLELFYGTDEVIVLGDGKRYAGNIRLLEGIGADGGVGNVPRDRDHRNGVQESRGDAGDEIRRPRAGGGDHDAHSAGRSGVTVRSVRGALLMGRQNVRQFVTVFVKGIIDVDHLAAGIAEYDVNALIDQRAHQDVRTG